MVVLTSKVADKVSDRVVGRGAPRRGQEAKIADRRRSTLGVGGRGGKPASVKLKGLLVDGGKGLVSGRLVVDGRRGTRGQVRGVDGSRGGRRDRGRERAIVQLELDGFGKKVEVSPERSDRRRGPGDGVVVLVQENNFGERGSGVRPRH